MSNLVMHNKNPYGIQNKLKSTKRSIQARSALYVELLAAARIDKVVTWRKVYHLERVGVFFKTILFYGLLSYYTHPSLAKTPS